MCFHLKHFPAHHSERTSLTPAVISKFKVHEMHHQPGLRLGPCSESLQRPPGPLAGLGGGEGPDKEGGELGKEGKGGGKRGKGRRGGGQGEEKERGGTRPRFERN